MFIRWQCVHATRCWQLFREIIIIKFLHKGAVIINARGGAEDIWGGHQKCINQLGGGYQKYQRKVGGPPSEVIIGE